MASVLDVAKYILEKHGEMSAMKLQKLVYYAQAWSLVWDDSPLFDSRIEAWANGPVCPELYDVHRGCFFVTAGTIGDRGRSEALKKYERDTLDIVLENYADKSARWLSEQTHSEAPWRNARKGIPPSERSNKEISWSAMGEFYGSL